MKKNQTIAIVWLLALLVFACKPGATSKAIFVGENDTPTGLSFSVPAEFMIPIAAEKAGKHTLELEITYDPEAMKDASALPLYYQWVLPNQEENDNRFSVTVRENGAWMGDAHSNDTYKVLKYTIGKNLEFVQGNHVFRLFADTGLNNPLSAIKHLLLRVN